MELYMHRMKHGKIAAFPALTAFVEAEFNMHGIRQIFPEHLSSFLSKSLLMITAQRLTGCDVLSRCQHCKFTQKRTALLNSGLSCEVDSCGEANSKTFLWLSFGQNFNRRNQIYLIFVVKQQKLFYLLQLLIFAKLYFQPYL